MTPTFIAAQAAVERGMLDAMVAGAASARYQLEALVGPGNVKWVVIAGVALLLFWAFKRR